VRGRLKRAGLALLLLAAALAWAGYWASRFFAARGKAEAAMDRLQPLLIRGFPDPELSAAVDSALAESHRALAFALAGPVLILLGLFAALWLLARRG
jgi:hypothetical protein